MHKLEAGRIVEATCVSRQTISFVNLFDLTYLAMRQLACRRLAVVYVFLAE